MENSLFNKCIDYIGHSILYYEFDKSIVSDGDFDSLCRELLNSADHICNTECFKDTITKDALIAGTGYHIKLNNLHWSISHIVKDRFNLK